jgi:hypothetical protein
MPSYVYITENINEPPDMQSLNYVDLQIVSTHPIGVVYINPATQHHSLLSTGSFRAGDVICDFRAGAVHTSPNRYTVQTGELQHIILEPAFLQYINHSCSPNSFFDTDSFQLVALQDIVENDEFTFFYPSTEWNMSEPFVCLCGEENCIGTIRGASQISSGVISQYRVSSYIKRQLELK